jgi:hypothetical protein
MIDEPYLAIYVRDGNVLFTRKSRKDNEPFTLLHMEVDKVIAEEFDEAARKVGGMALGVLSLWHPDVFRGWGIPLQTEGDLAEDDYGLANLLIATSKLRKTGAHVRSIELLLKQAAVTNENAKMVLEVAWPSIRASLESFGNGDD